MEVVVVEVVMVLRCVEESFRGDTERRGVLVLVVVALERGRELEPELWERKTLDGGLDMFGADL